MSQYTIHRVQQWRKILDLTRQMRALSIAHELEQLVVLQQQRQHAIEDFFASPVSAEEAEQVATGIREILDSDQLIYQQGEEIKSKIGASLQKTMGNRKALDTYHGVSQS